jgi:ribosomal protein S18 acetylase RimI-like enzyme
VDRSAEYVDKRGKAYRIGPYRGGDDGPLIEMYDGFSPKGIYQGMPPVGREACRRWVRGLIRAGDSFLAWQDDNVIGHVVLLPDFQKEDAEYLIFVSRAYRGRGVGSELTRRAIEGARALGIKTVWLTVGAYNIRAIRLYRKFAFDFVEEPGMASERTMVRYL